MKRNLLSFTLFCFSLSLFAQASFIETTTASGIANPGNKNRGISFVDYDNDGDQDIYAYTRLNENKLYENNGDGTFFDIGSVAGIAFNGNTRAATWGDLNNDGFQDLYLANYQSPDIIYINNGPDPNGQFTFSNITAFSGIEDEDFEDPKVVIMADYDNDGDLDIYLSNFNTQNRLYRNNGNLTFTDVVYETNTTDIEMSMSAIFFDYDNDNDLDLYLVHDFDIPNILYQNDGNGYFTDVSETVGVNYAGDGMGVDVADINNDGWMDIYITNLYENTLYLNNTDGTFTDISAEAGIQDYGMGWGTFFIDYDNDGYQDIYVINDSHFSNYPNVLYRNEGDNTFQVVGHFSEVSSDQAGFGGACADINGDGFLDIIIANSGTGQGNQVFQNTGNDNNWIAFDLKGVRANRNAVGAKVEITYNDGRQQTDEVHAGIGFAGQNDFKVHFGLAEAEMVDVARVVWPNGNVQELSDLVANQIHSVTEIALPVIQNTNVNSINIEKYGKFEVALDIDAMYDNPYDYDQIIVSATFSGPNGEEKTVDGFYMQDYILNESNGALTPEGDGVFKVRFSPTVEGTWTYQISVTDSIGTTTSPPETFECNAPSSPNNKGFVRTNMTNYLQFDEGEQYILVGENIAWQNGNAYTNYKTWLTKLAENGGNFFRLWHAHWGLGIEWKDGWNSFDGLRKYKEVNCRYQDWLFDYCAENDIYIMLALQHHGQVSTNVNPNWGDSPYNEANGGMCINTADFFTDESARAHTRNRFRYIVARWGYSRSIMAWELFNEVEWTDNFEANKEKVQDWHFEMAEYLKQIDPNNHIVTTSYAHENNDPVVWNSPDMDITQTHFYINTSNIERALAVGVRDYLDEFGKPTLTGEFGLGGSASLANSDPDGIHVHNSLWGALFGGGMGTGMTWWWDNYIHPRNLYYHFAGVSAFADEVPFLAENMSPASSYVSGTSGDLQITPTLGWGSIGESDFEIDENGLITPANVGLCIYLYGSEWNTQFRSPPSFNVNFPSEGVFTVRTNSEAGQNPKIAIYLNGVLALEESAGPNQEFSISVPAGNNQITVDNTGTDWITIAYYEFSGIGSKIDAYVLKAESNQMAAGWLLNNEYNHENVEENGEPDPAVGGELVVNDFEDGNYSIFWYDCLTGELVNNQLATAENNQLTAIVPELYWDLAFLVNSEPLSSKEAKESLAFKVYPSPATVGQTINIGLPENLSGFTQMTLMDMAGKQIQSFEIDHNAKNVEYQLPVTLTNGMYWIRLQNADQLGSQLIMVVRP